MRLQDRAIFLAAAKEFKSWILVRRTNRASLDYIGKPGYTPKRIDCKAKTADNDQAGYKLAGLVVDPQTHPGAFTAGKTQKAKDCWLAMRDLIGTLYKVDADPKSRHYGCLMLDRSYIHADYDLYDIIDINHPQRNLAIVEVRLGPPHMRGPKLLAIEKFINGRIGSPMVQHGGEAQYADHSEQSIDAFGPNGEDATILNEFSVRGWYETIFRGRKALG
jgi:hypothetical protein